MPVQRVGPDTNGQFYNAIDTSSWQGAEGAQLRAAGWTYAGYGTWGVYLNAPAGGGGGVTPGGGPYILPPAPQDPGGAPAPAPASSTSSSSGGCGCGSRGGMMPGGGTSPAAAGGAPAPVVVSMRDELEGIPRWIWWVLVVLALIVLLRG